MDAAEFGIGAVVELKSGGPAMTITQVVDTPDGRSAWCQWFDGETKHGAAFPLVCLRAAASAVDSGA